MAFPEEGGRQAAAAWPVSFRSTKSEAGPVWRVVQAPAVPLGRAGAWCEVGRIGFLSPLTSPILEEGVGWTFENAFS